MILFRKNKLKEVVKRNKKLKESEAYKELKKIEKTLEEIFTKESFRCKFFKENKCNHKKNNMSICNIDKCPK